MRPGSPQYAALLQRLNALREQADTLHALAATTDPEQVKARTEQATALAAQMRAAKADLDAADALHAAEAALPAASTPAGPGYVSVTPRAEKDPKRGFASVGEFAIAVHGACAPNGRGRIDERLAITLADNGVQIGAAAPTPLHQEGHASDGYMVPPDFRREIWRPAFESDELLALLSPVPTESNSVQFAADESTPWGAAGVVAYWVAEGAQITGTKLATKGREVKLNKVGVLVNCTDEILADASLLTSRINEAAPQAIGWTVAEAFMRGTGAGQPLGWENSGAKVSITKETSQTAATIVSENVLKMYARVLAGPGARIVCLANRDTLPQVAALKIGNEPSWTAQGKGLQEAPNGMLLGAPLHWSEHCQTLGTAGDIQFVNTAGFAVYIHSGGTRFDSSIHLYFDYGIQSFRWTTRVGGQSLLSGAVSPHKGSATKSFFVYLDTRS